MRRAFRGRVTKPWLALWLRRAARAAVWGVRLVEAAASGFIVRHARRFARRPPRIWHGLSPMIWEMYMVAADQAAGFPSRGVHRSSRNATYAVARDPRSHVVLDAPGVMWDDVHWLFLRDLLHHGDIFVGYFESLFFRPDQERANAWTLRLLRALGIRIIVCAHGGDVVHASPQITRYDWVAREQRDYPEWDLRQQATPARARIRAFCARADLVLPGDSAMARFLPRSDILFKYWPIDTDELRPRLTPQRPLPVIVHAPNHRFTKGTDFLLEAIDALRTNGIACELRLVERVPRHEALRLYADADIVADQFCIGAFGALALEAAALGKPVLTYLDQETLGNPVFNLPIVNATPEYLRDILAALLQIGELRERLGRAARVAAERYHSIPALAEVWGQIYRHVWWKEPLTLEATQHFTPTRGSRPFCEDPAQVEFWPVDVSDLAHEIVRAIDRTRGLRRAMEST